MDERARTLTVETIARHCGDIPDWKTSAIERSGGTLADLEIALAWAAGESDVMGEERRPLEGIAAEIYDILTADEEDLEDWARA